MPSPKFALDKTDVAKISKGGGIAALAAILTYACDLANIYFTGSELNPDMQLILMTAWSMFVNAARKFLTENRTKYNKNLN